MDVVRDVARQATESAPTTTETLKGAALEIQVKESNLIFVQVQHLIVQSSAEKAFPWSNFFVTSYNLNLSRVCHMSYPNGQDGCTGNPEHISTRITGRRISPRFT